MSETPRTEKRLAEIYQVPVHGAAPIVDAAFARTLERELAGKDARITELEQKLSLIGERAVADWDNATVGEVDAACDPFKYKDWLREVLVTLPDKLSARDAELSELRGMYEGMKYCQKNANEAAREFADAATRAESERDELRAALASEKDDKDTAIEILNRRGEMLSAERAHADRLAELLPLAFDDDLCNWDCTAINDALTAHEARRKGLESTRISGCRAENSTDTPTP